MTISKKLCVWTPGFAIQDSQDHKEPKKFTFLHTAALKKINKIILWRNLMNSSAWENCAWANQLLLSKTRISLPPPSFDSPVHNAVGLVITAGEGVRGDSKKEEKKFYPGLGPKQCDRGWEFRINSRWESNLGEEKKKQNPALAPSISIHVPCAQLE